MREDAELHIADTEAVPLGDKGFKAYVNDGEENLAVAHVPKGERDAKRNHWSLSLRFF